jgi:carboxypeptidase C (cathepsin A)
MSLPILLQGLGSLFASNSQPAGVGFSTVTRSANAPVTLSTAAQDFNIFLNVFYTSIFPSLSTHPLHLIGESFGGRYVPNFTKYILDQQKAKKPNSVPAKLESMVLVNAVLDNSASTLGQIDRFCSGKPGENGFGTGFNSTACAAMKRAAPECERQGQICRDVYTLSACKQSRSTCDSGIAKWFGQDVGPGGRNPYDGQPYPFVSYFLQG